MLKFSIVACDFKLKVYFFYLLFIENGCWPEEAYSLVAATTRGSIIYTQIADYTPDGIPLVLCFVLLPDKVSFSIIVCVFLRVN